MAMDLSPKFELVMENETGLFGETDEDVCLSTIDLTLLNEKSTYSLVASAVSTGNAVCSNRFEALDQNGLDKIWKTLIPKEQNKRQSGQWQFLMVRMLYPLSVNSCSYFCWFTILSLRHSHFIWTTIQSDCMHVGPRLPIHLQI